MRLKYTSFLLSLLTAWAICTAALPARAGVYTYGASQRTINAGVLLNGSYATAANADPYPFYMLSQRPDVRPYGWNLVNPLAPRSIESDTLTRWKAIDPTNLYTLGQPVLPSMAAYWEVRLSDVTSDDLAQYDVLLLNLSQANEVFTAAISEKLRRYVDGGGVLWIEQSRSGAKINGAGPLFSPLDNLTFISSGGSIALTGAPARPPILTTPYALSEQEILSLGDSQNGQWSHTGGVTLLQSILMAGGNALSFGQLGAGTVVVSSTQCANAINNYANPNLPGNAGSFSGINYSAAPSGDLKLMCNIIASAGAGPHEHQNAHQQGGSANSLTAAVLSWTYNVSGGNTSPVINGNITYVVDAAGTLHAFDTNPSEDLDSDGNPDDGDIQNNDFGAGKPYDELWRASVGPNASAPTVAFDSKTGTTAVFVEQKSGDVLEFDAATKTGGPTPRSPLNTFISGDPKSYASGTGASAIPGPAPAPTIYDGRLYAGQADGSLYIHDFVEGTSKDALLAPNIDAAQNTGTEFVFAPPSIGIQTESQRGADTNDIIAYVTTNHGLYTVFCGARGEALTPIPATTPNGYNTKLQTLKPTGNAYGHIDSARPYRTYTLSAGLPNPTLLGAPNNTPPTDFLGTVLGTPTPAVFADYDLDFKATLAAVAAGSSTDTGPLTRTGYSLSSQTRTQSMDSSGQVSAPALDRNGNAYFTTTDTANPGAITLSSSLLCVHDSSTPSSSTIAWRFRLPGASESVTDADNTSYAPLAGFQFVGSPVVDGQGNVYALASNGASAAVLCFNGLGPVTLDVFGTGLAQSIASATYTQPFGASGDQNEFGDPLAPIGPQQYLDKDSSGHLTLINFGMLTGMNGRELSPNLSEPQPITVQYTPSSGPTSTGASTLTSVVVPLHTNLNWYVVTSAPGATGLTLAGNRLYFGDSSGNINKVIADPVSEGVPINSKAITAGAVSTDGTTMVSSAGNANVGAIGGSLSSADGLLMVNGLSGVSCFADRTTLVVEAGRVMEVDADGQATWVVDSTTRDTTAGGSTLLQNGTVYTGTPPTGQTVTTDINLNHPASVTQLTRNDYLVADSGNNRAVRFDRSGKVIWELTKFNDPNKYLTAGESNALNQPTSVQIFRQTVVGGGTIVPYTSGTAVHYLVADSGNNRVVEVTDTFNDKFVQIDPVTGNPSKDHQLTWISRTGDKQGRAYRYTSASYFRNASGTQYVIALVTNTRVAKPTGSLGVLAPANQDAPGGSIVLLDYIAVDTATATQKGGYISANVISGILVPLTSAGGFDLNAGAGTPSLLQIRNPRYLKPYTSATGSQQFLLADDNGVFDLAAPASLGAPAPASWGFTQTDYQAMTTPIVNSLGAFSRVGAPFVPSCIQRIGTDTVGPTVATSVPVGRYLVTNAYAEGEAANNAGKIGGEAFELHVVYNSTLNAFQTYEANIILDASNNPGLPAAFSGHTISRPGNTSPLEQPTFAYRLQ